MPYELTEIVAACTNPPRVQARQGPSTKGEGMKTWGPTTNQEVIYIQYPLATGKNNFLQWTVTLQGGPHARE